MKLLEGKNIIITGASRGIGKGIAEVFVKHGANIAFTYRSSDEKARVLEEELLVAGCKAKGYKSDASDFEAAQKLTKNVMENFGSIDVLVNNVGTYVPGKIIDEKEGNLEHMMNTNLYSNYVVTRGLISIFLRQKKGHIFNICSIASKVAYGDGGSYSISKFAFYGMSKCLRQELKEYNVKVTSILPGATRTGSWDGTSLSDERFVNPDDISESIYSAFNTSVGGTIEEIIIRPQFGDI